MIRRSRSSNEIEKLVGELDWSEEILSENIECGTNDTVNRARSCIGRRANLLYSIKTNCKNIDLANNVTKNPRSSVTRLSPDSSIKFPAEAFARDIRNPDLFSEVFSMAYTSASIFAFAEVRMAARNGMIDNSELDIVSTPVATGSIVKAFVKNQTFFRSQLKAPSYEFLSSLARSTDLDEDANASEDDLSKAEIEEQDQKKKALALINSLSIDYFGDDNAQSECLYMITRNPTNKRIALSFRGSTTVQDWIKDSKLVVCDIENPVSNRLNQSPTIGVHKGFKEYLHGESRTVTAETSCQPIRSISLSDEDNEASNITTHNLQRPPTTLVTGNDDKGGSSIELDCTNDDPTNSKIENFQDPSASDAFCEIEVMKQEDHKSTFHFLNFLGLDLSSFREKQKIVWSTMKWTPLAPYDSEDVLKKMKRGSEFFTKFAPPKNRAKNKSRLARILDEIMHLQKQYDDYRIYITGHSLGGALGLLAALEISERFGKVGQPVTFVGIGNPRAGTEGFRDAVTVLEREGKMRCISIHGHFDVVTMLPNSAFKRESKRRFCQSGFELILNSESSKFYMRRCEGQDNMYMQRMGLALFRADRIQERHHFATYLKELKALERPLQKLYLNDFYDKFVEQSLFPCSLKKMTPTEVRATRGRDKLLIIEVPSTRAMKRAVSVDDLKECENDEKV